MFATQEVSRLCVDLSVNVQQPRLAWHVLLLSDVLQRKSMYDPCVNTCTSGSADSTYCTQD